MLRPQPLKPLSPFRLLQRPRQLRNNLPQPFHPLRNTPPRLLLRRQIQRLLILLRKRQPHLLIPPNQRPQIPNNPSRRPKFPSQTGIDLPVKPLNLLIFHAHILHPIRLHIPAHHRPRRQHRPKVHMERASPHCPPTKIGADRIRTPRASPIKLPHLSPRGSKLK